MSTETFVRMDRYSALGMERPDPGTVCRGQCEGTGIVPVAETSEEPFHSLWLAAEEKRPSDDGWHLVTCPTCNGAGKRASDGE